ncbi:unnamed protein product, partial [Symbiodinium necroappetens]
LPPDLRDRRGRRGRLQPRRGQPGEHRRRGHPDGAGRLGGDLPALRAGAGRGAEGRVHADHLHAHRGPRDDVRAALSDPRQPLDPAALRGLLPGRLRRQRRPGDHCRVELDRPDHRDVLPRRRGVQPPHRRRRAPGRAGLGRRAHRRGAARPQARLRREPGRARRPAALPAGGQRRLRASDRRGQRQHPPARPPRRGPLRRRDRAAARRRLGRPGDGDRRGAALPEQQEAL